VLCSYVAVHLLRQKQCDVRLVFVVQVQRNLDEAKREKSQHTSPDHLVNGNNVSQAPPNNDSELDL
jgi:hypothetical protein